MDLISVNIITYRTP